MTRSGLAGWLCRTASSSTGRRLGMRRPRRGGELHVASGRKPRFGAAARRRSCAGRSLAEAFALLPLVRRRFRRCVSRSSGRRSRRYRRLDLLARGLRKSRLLSAGGREAVAAAAVAYPGRARAPRPGSRRLPRRRARLDRDLRERRAGSEGASSLRLAADRPDPRLLRGRERRRRRAPAPRVASRGSSGRRCGRRLGRGLRLDDAQPGEPGRTRAHATRLRAPAAFLDRRASADQVEVADAARDACLALER